MTAHQTQEIAAMKRIPEAIELQGRSLADALKNEAIKLFPGMMIIAKDKRVLLVGNCTPLQQPTDKLNSFGWDKHEWEDFIIDDVQMMKDDRIYADIHEAYVE